MFGASGGRRACRVGPCFQMLRLHHTSRVSVFFPGSFFFGYFEDGAGSIVPDGVVGAQTDPLRDGTVLLLRLGELLLGAERLVGLHCYIMSARLSG